MAGLIQNSLSNGNTALTPDTQPYDATVRAVDQPTQTVAGQLHSILAEQNPLSQQVQSGARDEANSRGLINSSIAAGAGQDALIKNALPIAQQDASTYLTTAAQNQGYQNDASKFNAGAVNTANLAGAQAGNQSLLSTQQSGEQKGIIGAQAEQQRLTQAAGAEQTAKLSAQEASQRTAQQTQAETAAARLSAQQSTQAQTLQSQQIAGQKELQDAQIAGQKALQASDATTKTALANIEADYKTLMQSSQSAADLYKSAMTMLTAISTDANMDAASKQTAINNQMAALKSGLNLIGSVNGMDLTGLLPP